MTDDVLNKLRDIHLPKEVGLWPFAYGWYILIAIVAILIALGLIVSYKRYRNNLPRKAAVKALDNIEKNYKKEKSAPKTAEQIISLIKRFYFSYHVKRESIASLHSKELAQFLGNPPWIKSVSKVQYMKDSDINLTPVFAEIRLWIKQTHPGGKGV